MRRMVALLVLAALLVTGTEFTFAADSISLSPQKLSVDSQNVDCEKYNINNSNYFKLRDIAKLLSGTESEFDVSYDSKHKTIAITTGKKYTPVGGELAQRGDYSSTAVISPQTLVIDGKEVNNIKAYLIGGNNFFKLRDLGTALDFKVDYDAKTNTALIFGNERSEAVQGPRIIRKVATQTTNIPGLYTVTENQYVYDAAGNVVKDICYMDGDKYEVKTYTYDSDNNMLQEKMESYGITGEDTVTSVETVAYTYKNGRKATAHRDSMFRVIDTEFTYDGAGRLIKEYETKSEDNSFYREVTYSYDENGNLSEMYASMPPYATLTQYSYKNGNLRFEKTTGAYSENSEYEYNSDGQMLLRITHRLASPQYEVFELYQYDEKGNIETEYRGFFNEVIQESIITVLDENEDAVRLFISPQCDPSNYTTTTYTYYYDK